MRGVVITGASRGLGAALARLYAAPGVQLGLIGRDAAALAETVQACEARGAVVQTAICDVTDFPALRAALAGFEAAAPTDVLIANAGIAIGPEDAAMAETVEVFDQVVAVNLSAAVHAVLICLPFMLARGRGRLALIASVAGYRGLPDGPAYSASKAGLHAFGEGLRARLHGSGVGVTVAMPGFFASAMSDRFSGIRWGIVSAETMAGRIKRAIDRGRGRVVTPAALGLLLQFIDTLPAPVVDWMMRLYRFRIMA
jgi:short-subunit dehydrogenase